jgi:hypothetical protein
MLPRSASLPSSSSRITAEVFLPDHPTNSAILGQIASKNPIQPFHNINYEL